ncbi:MAG: ABC transporter ATP-binding protein [Anaerolineales bacterium]|nr:ABC transporter ATP-binding protein [Anaerolineales bacterium]
MPKLLLDVQGLKTTFNTQDGIVHAVNGVSFGLNEGETLGVVGESGCGKSVTMLSILGLIPDPPGKVGEGKAIFFDRDLLKMKTDELREIRGAQISMIFQDPMTSLNPVLTVGFQLKEALKWHLGMTDEQAQNRAIELLEMVGIPNADERINDYPHQYSGGMRQRVMIAMALSCSPQILIADEPTTALDVTIQAQITDLVKRLRDELGMAVIWITHDLGVVAGLADRVIVMYAGFIVENALINELYENPQHPYTAALLRSLPRMHGSAGEKLENIEGVPPDLVDFPKGCPFAPRCKFAVDKCLETNPMLEEVSSQHYVACWVDMKTGGLR